MTHCTAVQSNEGAAPAVCACSGEDKCGWNPPSRAPCCCLAHCTCEFPQRGSHHSKYSHHPRQQLSPRSHAYKDGRSNSRRCLYCLPEQLWIHEDDIVNRQQRCRSRRAALLRKRRDLKDNFLPGPCLNSYRSNAAELLRISSNKYYQRELDREYETRVQKLREELRSREREWASRNRSHPPYGICESNHHADGTIWNAGKAFPPPCQRCHPRGYEARSPKYEPSRGPRELPCDSPRPKSHFQHWVHKSKASSAVVGRNPFEDTDAPRTKSKDYSPIRSPRSHSRKKSLGRPEKNQSFPVGRGKTISPARGGGVPAAVHWSEDKKGSYCPSCGHPLTRASAAEVVSMLAKGKFNFSHCRSCGFVSGKPLSFGSKAAEQPLAVGSPARRAYSASSVCSRKPLYGRRVFITDDRYLDFRLKLFSQWEKSGAIERVPHTQRSSSASLSDCTPKWRTLHSRSMDAR